MKSIIFSGRNHPSCAYQSTPLCEDGRIQTLSHLLIVLLHVRQVPPQEFSLVLHQLELLPELGQRLPLLPRRETPSARAICSCCRKTVGRRGERGGDKRGGERRREEVREEGKEEGGEEVGRGGERTGEGRGGGGGERRREKRGERRRGE